MPAAKYRTHCSQGHAYTPENTGKDGKGRCCRTCKRSRFNIWLEEDGNKERRAKYWKFWRYGLTPEAYKELYETQKGKCAIPSCPNLIEHIDHDHITNKVRGLLCQKCNRGLGHFHDNPTLLREAASYLENQNE